jgi:uncharacterized coiled-coil DUF342 family protein
MWRIFRGTYMGIMNQMSRMFSKSDTSAPVTEPEADIAPAADAQMQPEIEPQSAPVSAAKTAPELMPVPAPASSSSERLDMELTATFETLEHGQDAPRSAHVPPSAPSNNDDLSARLAEAEARLSLITESHAVAMKERDAADEGRRKLEKTLSEFLARFASVRETQSAAFKEVEKLTGVRSELEKRNEELMAKLTQADETRHKATRELEQKVSDLTGQLGATEEAWAKAKKERDELQVRIDRQQQEVLDARAELSKFQEMAVASLEPLGVEFSKMMKQLAGETETIMSQMQQARDEAAQKQEALNKLADSLKAHINSSRKELSQKLSMVIGGPAGESGTRPAITGVVPPSPAPAVDGASSAAPVALAS